MGIPLGSPLGSNPRTQSSFLYVFFSQPLTIMVILHQPQTLKTSISGLEHLPQGFVKEKERRWFLLVLLAPSSTGLLPNTPEHSLARWKFVQGAALQEFFKETSKSCVELPKNALSHKVRV